MDGLDMVILLLVQFSAVRALILRTFDLEENRQPPIDKR